jgi:hypothetical protein
MDSANGVFSPKGLQAFLRDLYSWWAGTRDGKIT